MSIEGFPAMVPVKLSTPILVVVMLLLGLPLMVQGDGLAQSLMINKVLLGCVEHPLRIGYKKSKNKT
jgi:hypothetical protein